MKDHADASMIVLGSRSMFGKQTAAVFGSNGDPASGDRQTPKGTELP